MVPKSVLDFNFESSDGFGKLFIAVLMSCIMAFFYMLATRNTRAFLLGTDQTRCTLSIISRGWFAGVLLLANYLLIVFTCTLWICPFAELLVCKKNNGTKALHSVGRNRHADKLIGRGVCFDKSLTNSGFGVFEFRHFANFCLCGQMCRCS